MIWYILISLLLIFLLWLLFVPVIIYTNTSRNRYYLTLPGIIKAVLVPEGGLFRIRGWIFFIPFQFNPFRQRKSKKEKKSRENKKKRKYWRSGNLSTFKGALRSFRIKRMEADIDTDDFTLNAWLVPVFTAVNGENISLRINFEGHQFLFMDLRVTLGTLLWNIIRAKYRIFKPY